MGILFPTKTSASDSRELRDVGLEVLNNIYEEAGYFQETLQERWREFKNTAQDENSEDQTLLHLLSFSGKGSEQTEIVAGTARGATTLISSPATPVGTVMSGISANFGFLHLVIGSEMGKLFSEKAAEEEDKDDTGERYLEQGRVIVEVCKLAENDPDLEVRKRAQDLETLSQERIEEIQSYLDRRKEERLRGELAL